MQRLSLDCTMAILHDTRSNAKESEIGPSKKFQQRASGEIQNIQVSQNALHTILNMQYLI